MWPILAALGSAIGKVVTVAKSAAIGLGKGVLGVAKSSPLALGKTAAPALNASAMKLGTMVGAGAKGLLTNAVMSKMGSSDSGRMAMSAFDSVEQANQTPNQSLMGRVGAAVGSVLQNPLQSKSPAQSETQPGNITPQESINSGSAPISGGNMQTGAAPLSMSQLPPEVLIELLKRGGVR